MNNIFALQIEIEARSRLVDFYHGRYMEKGRDEWEAERLNYHAHLLGQAQLALNALTAKTSADQDVGSEGEGQD